MKCKNQQEMSNPKLNITARGGNMLKGNCSVCGCGMCKIISKADAEAYK